MRVIDDVAADLGLDADEVDPIGRHRGRLTRRALDRLDNTPTPAQRVLVTAMTPTRAGVGKTVTSIGLAMALNRLGRPTVATLRQSSLGPTLGRKGGGAGGGRARVEPFTDALIGLGADLFAVETATNLLAAAVDESLARGEHGLDPSQIWWRRCIDLDDRALRHIIVSARTEQPRSTGFVATAASEVMAVLALARDLADLRARLGRIVVGRSHQGELVTAEDLQAAGAMAVLLAEAARPHLFQSSEGTPVLVHTGPYANLGTGNCSVIADRLGQHLADIVVTEGGFGSDLGAEKFMHLKRPHLEGEPGVAVLVASVAAVAEHGGDNLVRHIEHLAAYGLPVVVALNRFHADDDPAPIAAVAEPAGARAVVAHDAFGSGSAGCGELAEQVASIIDEQRDPLVPLYDPADELEGKLGALARRVYGARGLRWSDRARSDLAQLRADGLASLSPCVAKTPLSLGHDPAMGPSPADYELDLVELVPYAGAGYVVARCGPIVALPGMPDRPRYRSIELAADGTVEGLV